MSSTDPQVMISYSDDGGHTWSAEQWHSLGVEGDYLRRVVLTQQGNSRDRRYRLRFTDPFGWTLIAAHGDVEFAE